MKSKFTNRLKKIVKLSQKINNDIYIHISNDISNIIEDFLFYSTCLPRFAYIILKANFKLQINLYLISSSIHFVQYALNPLAVTEDHAI